MSVDADAALIGQPIDRKDGRLKVTGRAHYCGDIRIPRMAHAVLLESTVTRGRVVALDAAEARKVPGFIALLTHEDGLRFQPRKPDEKGVQGKLGNGSWMPLQDAEIRFNGQPIAIAVAETLEGAIQAADLTKVRYREDEHNTVLEKALADSVLPKEFFGQKLQFVKGNALGGIAGPIALVEVSETYSTPVLHHNPMEPHATMAVWSGEKLTVYDTTQGVVATQAFLAQLLGLPEENVRVVSHFLGGGFGCKGFFWPHTALTAAASRKLGRPLRLVLTRPQMFTSNGYRSRTIQEVGLTARLDGQLVSIRHASSLQTSRIAEFVEPCGFLTKMLYASPEIEVSHRLAKVDTVTPTPMRAPGEAPGSFALEVAMDELSYRLRMDPIELRLKNYAETNPEDGKPWSSKRLRECYEKGADLFGWSQRVAEPRAMRKDGMQVGWGMATAVYPANRSGASARAVLRADGSATVYCATQDIGTGTYTTMAQIAADALGLPIENVRFELGNTAFPEGPVSGGSQTSASVGPAVQAAAKEVRSKAIKLAIADSESPLHGALESEVSSAQGRLFLGVDEARGEAYGDILKRANRGEIEARTQVEANTRNEKANAFAFHSWGAQFAEVRVDPEFGTVRLGRMVGAYDVGRILNHKTARSQAIGGMTWAAGMALLEETVFDPRYGRIVTRNLADYRVPVAADIPPIDVYFVDKPDPHIGAIGARGLGEIPITGMVAAIANAVYHAMGKRVRSLPITPENLMA